MSGFLQAAALILLAVVIGVFLSKQSTDAVMAVSIAVSVIVLCTAVRYLNPVIDFLEELRTAANVDQSLMEVLLKAVGIGMITEIVGLICADTGNSALGKALQILSAGVMLWLSIPLMRSLLELVEQIMGGL